MSQYTTDLFKTSCGVTAPLELNVSGPGWAGGKRHVFEQPFVLIGRHEHASLRLEDAAVSRRHAYLQRLGGRVFCVDLASRNGIRWGGEIRPAGWLRPDQGIQIGPFTLELPMPAQDGGGANDEIAEEWDPLQDRINDSQRLPWIIVEGDNKVLAELRMNRVLVLVGSSPACRIRLREAGIARHHCSLVRTPEGILMIDLLNEARTCLNGQPVRWALLKEGDQFQVGPYRLRLRYQNLGVPDRDKESLSSLPSPSPEIPPEPGGLSVSPGNILVQTLALPRAEQTVTEEPSLVPALQAELDQARARLRDAEALRQQLTDSQSECVRLRDQVRTLGIQVAEVAGLQARLEAAETRVRELEGVCAERDQWQVKEQTLQASLAAGSAEREEWQHRLEEAQQQLVEQREAVRAMGALLERESATLQSVRADLVARSTEHSAALQRLKETQDALARSKDEMRGLQAELEKGRERLGDAEVFRQQLADSQAECVRFRDQVGTLEIQLAEAAELQSRLEAVEANARKLEGVCAERDQLQAEAQTLQTKLASERAEREQWQHRLEEAQQQLVEQREAVRAMGALLERESATLQGVRADLVARSTEHSAALQRLQETQDELARSQEETRGLQTELDQARERLADAEALRQRLADTQAKHDQLCARAEDLETQATSADLLRNRLQAADAETEQLRVQLRAAETRATELESTHAECVRLCDQVRTLEMQVAEAVDFQARLEAVQARARELEGVCAERDQWQAEAQTLQTKLASEGAEREQWQHRLEEAQQQLVEQREAVRAMGALLERESAALQGVQADLAARNAEHSAALQRLQETQDALARSQDETRSLQAELEQGRERLGDAEVFRQQLADSQAECVRLRDQVRTLESQLAEAAELQSRLEAVEASARKLEGVCAERDQLQAEAQSLRNKLATDSAERQKLDSLATDLHAARDERNRLHTEQQAALHSAKQAWARVANLERALTEAAAAHEKAVAEARAGWESERQALEARIEQERQTHYGATQTVVGEVQTRVEAAIRTVQARAAAEREEWRQRLEGAEAQIVWERGLFQEQGEQSRRQIALLQTERDRLASRLAQAEQFLRAAEERFRNESGRVAAPEPLRPHAVLDQLFTEFRGVQAGHLLGQAARTQGQDKQAPVGQQHRPSAIQQGVEAAWIEAGTERERPATAPKPPDPKPAVPSDTGEASISSDLPQGASVPGEASQPIEDLRGPFPEQQDETTQGRWRRILNFVLGK